MSGQRAPEAWDEVAKACHDLNNVVTVVQGLCDLILIDHSRDAELVSDIKEIRENIVRAGGLIERLHVLAAERRGRSR